MFDISFVADQPEHMEGGHQVLLGRTVLGGFSEEFLASLEVWSPSDYEAHWLDAATRLMRGEQRTGFWTSAFQFWWIMWRDGDLIYVREQILVGEGLSASFDPKDPYSHIGPRQTDHAVGETPSEWLLRIDDVAAFIARRGPHLPP